MPEFNEGIKVKQIKSSTFNTSEKEKCERALSTLKAIAQGYGSNPKIYAQNTLNSLGIKY